MGSTQQVGIDKLFFSAHEGRQDKLNSDSLRRLTLQEITLHEQLQGVNTNSNVSYHSLPAKAMDSFPVYPLQIQQEHHYPTGES